MITTASYFQAFDAAFEIIESNYFFYISLYIYMAVNAFNVSRHSSWLSSSATNGNLRQLGMG